MLLKKILKGVNPLFNKEYIEFLLNNSLIVFHQPDTKKEEIIFNDFIKIFPIWYFYSKEPETSESYYGFYLSLLNRPIELIPLRKSDIDTEGTIYIKYNLLEEFIKQYTLLNIGLMTFLVNNESFAEQVKRVRYYDFSS